MRQYHWQIFEEIRNKQNIFLLNGPSIKELQDKICGLKEENVIYWGVNNIEGIDEDKIDHLKAKITPYLEMIHKILLLLEQDHYLSIHLIQ